MRAFEPSWVLMSTYGCKRVCCHERSWELIRAHTMQWCNACKCVWLPMSHQKRSWVLMSLFGIMAPWSCLFMTVHWHSRVLMNTMNSHKHSWAWHHGAKKAHKRPRAYMSRAPGALLSFPTIKAPCCPCPSVLHSAQECSGVLIGAYGCSWVLKCLIQ